MNNWISTISTVVLVLITAYYAIVTHGMLKYQKDSTALDYRPFLRLNRIKYILGNNRTTNNSNSIQIALELENVSRVLLKYEVNKLDISLDNKKNENMIFLNNGTYVYPSQIVDYTCTTIDFNNTLPEIIEGRIEYEIKYYTTNKKKYKSYRKYAIFIQPKSNYISWKSLEEHEEEV